MGAGEMFKFEISLAASERHRGVVAMIFEVQLEGEWP